MRLLALTHSRSCISGLRRSNPIIGSRSHLGVTRRRVTPGRRPPQMRPPKNVCTQCTYMCTCTSLHSKFTNDVAVSDKFFVLKYLRVCFMLKHAVTKSNTKCLDPSTRTRSERRYKHCRSDFSKASPCRLTCKLFFLSVQMPVSIQVVANRS